MANIIKPKRSNTAGVVPTTSNLTSGELGVNMADQKTYINNGTSVVQIGAGNLSGLGDVTITTPASGQSLQYDGSKWVNGSGGSGDVQGPASSTDNALVRFDGTTGKIVQNGVVTQDDNGTLANVNAISLDTTPTSLPTATGSIYWDEGNKTPTVVIDTDVALQLGQEMLALVYNGTGSTITNGSVVAVSGAQGQRPSVVLADADSESLSAPTLGIATEDIANGAEGFVTTFGFVRGINTSAFTAGAPIYLSQTAGQFTATRPSAPAHTVALGWVIKVNASSGEVFVNINNGWELDELHNVLITSPISGNTLIYDASVGVWKNANLTDGTGINITEGAGSITIALANTAVTAGSYTNASITVDAQGRLTSASSGTAPVTSVGATAPIASSGGTTPTISISQASSTTNGYLSSTDWNTFNNKTSNTGTVTSVTGGSYLTGGTITTSGTLAVDATSANTASKVVARDASGNFSAGTITATLSGNASTATTATNQSGGTVAATTGSFSGQVTSTLASGTAPFSITSTTLNTNLNADLLDGNHASAFYLASNPNGYTSNTGTVTSVSATVPTGLSISGSPITTSGTLAITYTAGYSIPTTASQTNWDSAYTQRLQWDGGSTNLVASTGRTSLGGTTVGQNFFTLTNPTAVTFPRINADNTVSALARQDAMDALAGSTTSGQYLRGNGTDVVMSAIQAADVPTLNQNTTGSAATLTTGRTLAITGDLTWTSPSFNGSANVTAAGTLATVNANVGSFGSSTAIPVVTVNAKGLVTAVSTATVAGGQYFGTATTKAIAYNANSIAENITVTAGNNGLSAGPITINTGFTVTVETGANWVIV